MIGVNYGVPYVNMDPYIDVEKFLSLAPEICAGIEQSEQHLCNPGSRTVGIENYPDLLHPYEAEKLYADEVAGMSDIEKRSYLKYYRKVCYPVAGVYIKRQQNYLKKHLAEYSEYTANAQFYPKFIEYVENDLPFSEVGRIFIFCQDHFAPLTEHRDSMNDEYDNELTDFLWLTIDQNQMQFYLRDLEQNKIFIEGCTSAWFNENDQHGSPGVADATFCIRIDGVFKPGIREQVQQNLCM